LPKLLAVVIISFAALIEMKSPSEAQVYSTTDTMSVVSDTGFPGDTIMVPIDLYNTFAVGGIQMRVTFDFTAFSPVQIDLTSRSNMFDLYGSNFSDSGVALFYATSWHPMENHIEAGDGDILDMKMVIRNNAAPGLYMIRFDDADSLIPQNALSNIRGDTLIVPILIDRQVDVQPVQSIGEEQVLPGRFQLDQNYPNPFNGATRIVFELEKPGFAEMKVYDLLGRVVVTLFSGYANSGQTVISWNGYNNHGENLASGLYYYRLVFEGDKVITKHMTILK
jgi:hypothetical protein